MQVEGLIGAHVFDLQTERYLGKVTHPIIDYEELKVLGFVFKRAFYYPPKAFEFHSIKKAQGDFVIIEKNNAKLLLRKRMLRRVFKKQRQIITLKLVEGEKQVGKVVDFIAEDDTGSIKTLLAEKSLFSDIFRIPVSKVERFDVDTFVLQRDAAPKKEKDEPGIFTRVLANTAKTIGSAVKRSKRLYSQGQKNMLLGQVSPCDIMDDENRILLRKGQIVTDELLQKLSAENKVGELSAAVVGSGIGTKYKSYRAKRKKKAIQAKNKQT